MNLYRTLYMFKFALLIFISVSSVLRGQVPTTRQPANPQNHPEQIRSYDSAPTEIPFDQLTPAPAQPIDRKSAASIPPTTTPQHPSETPSLPLQTLSRSPGLTTMKYEGRLFDTDQKIYVMEIDPRYYDLKILQGSDRMRVDRTGKNSGASAAINGGFFRTDTDQAIPTDYLRINGIDISPITLKKNSPLLAFKDSDDVLITYFDRDSFAIRTYENILVTHPMLLLNGEAVQNNGEGRNPRSVFGLKPDGTIVFLAIDGRQNGADGMTFAELSELCQTLGITDAVNLDGGGSTTLWSRQSGIVNSPSDKVLVLRVPRAVANTIAIFPKSPGN